ncbi:uncharacterized protein FFB14_03019 [Fusarium fujikuroi]|nr:uncharacterized protein FFB14_03019 [Fusarium fujikuroi]
MEEHMKRKDIENRLLYPPYRPDATDHWRRTPREIQEHITQLMTQKANIDTAEKDSLPRTEGEKSNKRTNYWMKLLKQQAAALAEEGMERVMAISEDTQAQVLAYNLDQVEKVEGVFNNWGQRCLGPRPSLQWVTERCPRNSRVGWTTAKVKLNRTGLAMDFDIRCIECAKEFALYELFQSYGVLSDDDDTGTVCMHEECSYPRLYRVLYCSVHILSHTVSGSTKAWKPEHQGFVSHQLQSPGNWKIDKSSNFEPFLNRRKLSAESRFFALDIEGYISRNPPVVEQAAAVSIDSVDGEDGKTLFNVNINGPLIGQGGKQYPTAVNQDFATNLLKFGTQDYWQYNKETLSGERVDPMRAVAIIQDSGITSQDYVVVWHKNYADLRALRHLFSQTGIQDILPPDNHVIRLNYLFRHNLNIPKGMMCSLELLFSIVFPMHPLRFTHHDALVDSRKTVLMALFAEKLCKGECTATMRGLRLQ